MYTDRLIVVGVDGSEGARRALNWALEHAGRTGAVVEVITAFAGEDPALPAYTGSARGRADELQQAELAAVLRYVDSPPVVAREVVAGEPVGVLSRAAASADMLVVGSHGSHNRSRLRAALMGSVSEGCIRQAPCPVLVVPTPRTTPPQREVIRSARRL
jgi:nucleotide-binding universal stress UspA family protein